LKYSVLLSNAIQDKNYSLSDLANKLEEFDVKIDKGYLSKLRSGTKSPASDRVNEALAKVLNIDPLELRIAAYKEKIPDDVLERLGNDFYE
jgi:transcriptional regulator with XRE-family HTH domain